MATNPYESFVLYAFFLTVPISLQMSVMNLVTERYRQLVRLPFSTYYRERITTLFLMTALSILLSFVVLGIMLMQYKLHPSMDYIGRIYDYKSWLGILVWCEIAWLVLNVPIIGGLAVRLNNLVRMDPMEAYAYMQRKRA